MYIITINGRSVYTLSLDKCEYLTAFRLCKKYNKTNVSLSLWYKEKENDFFSWEFFVSPKGTTIFYDAVTGEKVKRS